MKLALIDDTGQLFYKAKDKVSIYDSKEDALNDMAHGEEIIDIDSAYNEFHQLRNDDAIFSKLWNNNDEDFMEWYNDIYLTV